MALAAGTRIGSYEILGAIGAGGMGEVYRARDTKLNREVAIKVLPAFFASDPERLARFGREAQVLASLNHPNIAHVHGFEEGAPLGDSGVGAAGALVMELVEGPTLADRIAAGPIPIDEAVPIARQIVAALDAAHSQGIVHRDLKPANIKVREDGTVKVLDFGLAKLASPDPSSSGVSLANSPTLTAQSTQLGMVIGTAAYMAPEQARGKSVDKRADIWAFGAVLFEMLTGHQLYEGETVSEVLANVLKDEPKWDALPASTPLSLRRLLGRCLEKDPRRRLHDIADALPDLDEAATGGPAVAQTRGSNPLAYAATGLLVGAAVIALVFMLWGSVFRSAPAAPLEVLTVLPPAGQPFQQDTANVAISPDGRFVVFVAGTSGETAQLWLRPLDSAMPRALAGTKGAFQPFWSPDGSRIGFFADGKLKTIRIDGGAVTVVCDASDGRGGTWSTSGQIVFQPASGGPLMKVSAEGGDPQPATMLDSSRGETAHRFPQFLPDGLHFLYVALPGHDGHLDLIAGSIDDSKARTVLTTADSTAVYGNGYIVFERPNGVAAQAFDPNRLSLSGDPITLSDIPHDANSQWSGAPVVSLSKTGSLVSYAGAVRETRLAWFDAAGKQVGALPAPSGLYQQVAIAPNGKYAAVVRFEPPSRSDIWILDLQRGGATRLTNGPGANVNPAWSPDGSQIAFVSDRNSQSQIYVKPADGNTPERQISTDRTPFKSVSFWTKDGKTIVYTALDPKTQRDIWMIDVDGDHTPKPYLRAPFNEVNPSLSPDGRWVTYLSDETGHTEMYAQAFPVAHDKYQITTGGVAGGGWMPDGRIEYNLPGETIVYGVKVDPGPPFHTGPPQKLIELPSGMVSADALPDFSKLLVALPSSASALVTLTVVQNWPLMLKTR